MSTNDINILSLKNICIDCFDEKYIKQNIQSNVLQRCDYCKNIDKIIQLKEYANYIEKAIEQYYTVTPSAPDGFEEVVMSYNKDYIWHRYGESIGDIISEISGSKINNINSDIREYLELKHNSTSDIEENPFALEAKYIKAEANDEEFRNDWINFEKELIEDSRYFSKSAKLLLDKIFNDVLNTCNNSNNSLIFEIGPDFAKKSLFRSRSYQSEKSLEDSLIQPESRLGPPPTSIATAGRMNPHGVTVFYGATHPEVSVAEVRPPVGGRVILAEFKILKNLKLLNIGALGATPINESIFDPKYKEKSQKVRFMKRVCDMFSRAVMPNDENTEYIVTQVISDYFNSLSNPSFDGLMYPSSQFHGSDDKQKANVILFHKSSKVRVRETFKNYDVKVKLYFMKNSLYGQPFDVNYSLRTLNKSNNFLNCTTVNKENLYYSKNIGQSKEIEDTRPCCLELNLDNLVVYHIDKVVYDLKNFFKVAVDDKLK